MRLITITIICIMLAFNVSALSGTKQVNLTINLTSTNLTIYSSGLGQQVTQINLNTTQSYNLTYTWNEPYTYDLTGTNVTILNYSTTIYQCSAEQMTQVTDTIIGRLEVCNQSRRDATNYHQMYYDCFANMTICGDYRSRNTGFETQLQACNALGLNKDSIILQQQQQYFFLNETNNTCIIARDNYAGQRWVWSFLAFIIVMLFAYWYFRVRPNSSREGKIGTSRERFGMTRTSPTLMEADLDRPYVQPYPSARDFTQQYSSPPQQPIQQQPIQQPQPEVKPPYTPPDVKIKHM